MDTGNVATRMVEAFDQATPMCGRHDRLLPPEQGRLRAPADFQNLLSAVSCVAR